MLSEKCIFRLIEEYFNVEGVANLQLSSFNHFIEYGLQNIINEEPEIRIDINKNMYYLVRFGSVTIDKPYIIESDRSTNQITPAACRLRDLTYDAPVCVNITEETWESDVLIDKKQHNKIPITRIPIMLRSSKCNLTGKNKEDIVKAGECTSDPGGYFIIKGKERVLITQERVNYNSVFVFRQKPQSKYNHIAEIRSMSEETGHSILIQAKILPTGKSITFSLPYITQEIPAGIVLKAFDIKTPEQIAMVLEQGYVTNSIIKDILQESCTITSQEDALEYIGKFAMHVIPREKRIVYAKQMLENELFPHLGTTSTNITKVLFLGYMINKLVATHNEERADDDRDHVNTKRVEASGILIGDIFRSLYKRNNNLIKQYLTKRQDILPAISRTTQITNGLRHCFSTGNWGVQKNTYVRTGVSQVLSRLTWGATISHLRRLVIPIGKEGKNTKIRQIHASQWGFICPPETPEGQSSGIVKNFANMTNISTKVPTLLIKTVFESIKSIKPIEEFKTIDQEDGLRSHKLIDYFKVMLNGIWYGITNVPEKTRLELISCRTRGIIPYSVSISVNIRDREILVYCDEGRMLRPVFKVDNHGELLLTDEDIDNNIGWNDLIRKQYIKYIDSYEVENKTIATQISDLSNPQFTYKFDYCEIHPSVILGSMASMIPFSDHTQAPRNCYQAAMGKQALGIYSYANELRTDTIVHQLLYPQRPVTYTHASKCLGFNNMVSGINAIVAIACYTGFNQEDSILLNKSSVDRGLFRSFAYKTIVAEEKKRSANSYENIEVPPKNIQSRSYNYQKLDENGIIKEGKKVVNGDVIIGKVINKSSKTSKEQLIDNSIVIKVGEEGVIDKVFISTTPDGYKLVKVKIRNLRIPETGDKMACATENCEVLTESGVWKSIVDITTKDRVAILDNDNVSYEHPTEIHSYHYKGKMYELRSQQVDLTVTPNHRMWVKKRTGKNSQYCTDFDFKFAKDCFGKRLKYKKNINSFTPKNPLGNIFTIPEFIDGRRITRPPIHINMDDWLVFFGIWIAEGWADKKQVSIAAHKPRVKKALNSLESFNEHFHYSKSADGHQWSIYNVQLASYMKKYSVGAVNKYLPEWCWQLDKEQSRILLASMELGDGHRTKSNSRTYYTSSKILADNVTKLALHCGYSTHTRVPPGRKAGHTTQFTRQNGKVETVTTNEDNYLITIIKTKTEPEMNHGHTKTQSGQSERWIDFDDKVYCLTVRTGVFLVRENGKPVWSGNSRHAQKGTCGIVLPQQDMPFTEEGVVPDIIINPHCLPSRMTINLFLECLGSKSGIHKGIDRDCTAFSESSVNIVNYLYKELGELGYESNGYENLCSGYTGEQLTAKIFIGPVYYQRLKHLVGDKIHARDYGNVQSLTRQPLEGRSRDGGLRFGEMERDCLFLSSPISLYSGRSIMIGNMVDCDWDVLSWSEKNQYIEKDQQTAFKHKGTRPCVELTLQDGRKITCTHNHPLLTNKGDWVMASDFDLTSDKLVVSKSGPILDIDQEIKDCNGWYLEMITIRLNTNNKKELLRTHAFVRIVGILITDGHIRKDGSGCVFLGHKLDVESFLYDLSLFCDSKPNPLKQKHCYVINLPAEITHNINCLQGFVRGAKVCHAAVLPEFIKTAPKPIIREFLAAFFGGDGHTCVLGMHRGKRDILSSTGFSWSRKSEHIDSLVHVQNEIKNMLEMFGISGITIRTPKEISDSKQKSNADKDRNQSDKVYESNLHISIDYLIKFYEEIGFRHCCHKSQRLEAGVAYKRLRTEVTRQHNWLTNRVDELTGFSEIRIGPDKTSPINTKAKLKMPVCKAITQATDELRKKEAIVHQYGIPTTKDISDHLQKGTEFGKFRGKGFPNASEFLTEIGVIDWFKNNKTDIQNYGVCCNDNGMSSMYMRVIDRRDVGEKEVCDITVKNNHNFLAEGVVSHNCMISHGVSGFLKERLYNMSDEFKVNVCSKCGHIVTSTRECHVCNHDNIKLTNIPYACKLLFQELIAMGLKVSLKPT